MCKVTESSVVSATVSEWHIQGCQHAEAQLDEEVEMDIVKLEMQTEIDGER